MEALMLVVFGLFFIALVGAQIAAVVSAARTPLTMWQHLDRSRAWTVFLIVLTGGFGGVYYFWRIRPELRSAPRPVTSTSGPRRWI